MGILIREDISFRRAIDEDCPSLERLWVQDLDDVESLKLMQKHGLINENVFVAEVNCEVVAMLSIIPCRYNCDRIVAGYYLYGVTTDQSYRNKNIMTWFLKNMDQLCRSQKAEFILTIPATREAEGYYLKRGFRDTYLSIKTISFSKDLVWSTEPVSTVSISCLKSICRDFDGINVLFPSYVDSYFYEELLRSRHCLLHLGRRNGRICCYVVSHESENGSEILLTGHSHNETYQATFHQRGLIKWLTEDMISVDGNGYLLNGRIPF